MRDIEELHRALLGLTAPWTVAGVDVDMVGQRVVVPVDTGAGPYPCPDCGGTPVPRYDGKPGRWRQLDTMQFTTWIEAEVPRVSCATHGVKQLRVPWAEPGSQFTALFERLAIDLLRRCSITGAIRLLRISWDEGWGIKERAVKRGLARRGHEVVARLGVDEKVIARRHQYLHDRGRPGTEPGALPGRRPQAGEPGRLLAHPDAQRDGITAVAMDMWTLRTVHARAPARGRRQDRVRQVPRREESARGGRRHGAQRVAVLRLALRPGGEVRKDGGAPSEFARIADQMPGR
jgi:transposase